MQSNALDSRTNNLISLDTKPLANLRNYISSNYNRGRSNWLVMIWWFIQAIAFPLSLHNFNDFRCWLLRLFGAKIGQGVVFVLQLALPILGKYRLVITVGLMMM